MPVVLGAGIPLLPAGAATKLILADPKVLPASGIVALSYSVPGGVGPAPPVAYIKAGRARGKKRFSARRKVSKRKAPEKRSARLI